MPAPLRLPSAPSGTGTPPASRPQRQPTARPPARRSPLRLALARVLFAVATLATLAFHSSTHAASITATLDRQVIALGESAVLQIVLEGANENPAIPAVPGLDIRRVSSQRQLAMGNGRSTSSLQLGYAVTPSRLGEFTLGPFTVRTGNQTLTAPATQLRVVGPNDPAAARGDGLDKAAFLELHLPATEVFVGERFVAETHLYALGGNLRQSPQFQADGFTVGPVSNSPTETNIRTNDRIYARVRFTQPLTAARAGDLPLQAAGGLIEIPISRRGQPSDIFDEFFGGREVRRFNLATEPVTLRVLPLPREGQPPGFNGAVGKFTATLTATPTTVAAGDPITVRVEFRGRGNFDSIQLPEQPAWKGFRAYPPSATNTPAEPTGLTGTKTFEQVLIPESADLTELPGLEFSFFDPAARRYQTLRTPATPIRVSAGATTPTLPTTAANTGNTPKSSTPDLLPLKPHLGTIIPAPGADALTPWIRQPTFAVLYLLPVAGWGAFRLWKRQRARHAANASARQREQLLKRVAEGLRNLDQLRTQGDTDGFHATLFRTLQDAIAARTGLPPASITEGTLDTAFTPGSFPAETLASLHALFQACNQARYARHASPGDLQHLRDEADLATRKLAERPIAPA